MSVGVETPLVDAWIVSRLSTDATLLTMGIVTGSGSVASRVFNSLAPAETAMPLIVYQTQRASDVIGVGTARIMVDTLYVVKVIAQGSDFSVHKPIADRVDVLLHGAAAVVAGGEILSCVRTEPFSMVENDEGRQYRHLGGIFRIQALAN